MLSRQVSAIWKYFTYDSLNEKARCNICQTELSQRRGSTSNLNRHTRLKHPDLKLQHLTRRIQRLYNSTDSYNTQQEQAFVMELHEENVDVDGLIVSEQVVSKDSEAVNSPILNAALLVSNGSQSSEAQPDIIQVTEEVSEVSDIPRDCKPLIKNKRKKVTPNDNYILPMQQKYHSIKSQTNWSGPDAIHEVLHQRKEELETLREMTQALKAQTQTMTSVQQTMLEVKKCLVVQGEILKKMLNSQSQKPDETTED